MLKPSVTSAPKADMATLTVVQPLTLDRDVARAIELLEKLQESGEVPVQKLQSLKKVLQSEFCTAIRELIKGWKETSQSVVALQLSSHWYKKNTMPRNPWTPHR